MTEPAGTPRLQLVGTSDVCMVLQQFGAILGWSTPIVDGDEVQYGPDDVGVIVTSHKSDEIPALTKALEYGVPYVALLANRKRGTARVAELPVSDELKQRVRTPAGLNIGGRAPAEIAVSILSELMADHYGRDVTITVRPGVVDPPALRCEAPSR